MSREGIATQRVDSADANAIREAAKGFDALVKKNAGSAVALPASHGPRA
ncbi:hypothetical protein [Burkholderia sp. Bp8984]|nr:hypothetical protein [Burkholderia sp. Bp8984]